MNVAARMGRGPLLFIGPILLLILLGGYIFDIVSINLTNLSVLQGKGFHSIGTLTTWGECRETFLDGRYLLHEVQYGQALPLLQESVTCGDNPWGWYDLGLAQYGLGDLNAAADSWQHTTEGYNKAVRLANRVSVKPGGVADSGLWDQ